MEQKTIGSCSPAPLQRPAETSGHRLRPAGPTGVCAEDSRKVPFLSHWPNSARLEFLCASSCLFRIPHPAYMAVLSNQTFLVRNLWMHVTSSYELASGLCLKRQIWVLASVCLHGRPAIEALPLQEPFALNVVFLFSGRQWAHLLSLARLGVGSLCFAVDSVVLGLGALTHCHVGCGSRSDTRPFSDPQWVCKQWA